MPGAWRLVSHLDPRSGSVNMAVDAALLSAVREGAPGVLRLYRWDPSTLSFGRNQPARGLYDLSAARSRGIAFVRRPTGGQAVFHADELTYAVVAPVGEVGRPREAYGRINHALVAGLRELGVAATCHRVEVVRVGGGTVQPVSAPGASDWMAACFRSPAEGEVVVDGRKLVGSAQRCEGRVVLQHGSILVSGSQAPAEELLLRRSAPDPEKPHWTTLEEQLGGRPDWSTLAGALVAGFEQVFGTALAPGGLSVDESTRAKELRATFASPGWTWRR